MKRTAGTALSTAEQAAARPAFGMGYDREVAWTDLAVRRTWDALTF